MLHLGKFLCKKIILFFGGKLIIGNYYDIYKMESKDNGSIYVIIYCNITKKSYDYNFSLDKKNDDYIGNYFYTQSELRNKKLEKICSIQEI